MKGIRIGYYYMINNYAHPFLYEGIYTYGNTSYNIFRDYTKGVVRLDVEDYLSRIREYNP